MNNILLFEYFSPNLDLKNDLTNHLEQYPYLKYTLSDDGKNVILTFNKDISTSYGMGILDTFEKDILTKNPLKLRIKGMKNVDKFQQFQGKIIIQNIEKVDFPDLKLKGIECKIDSGATTSSLHCSKIKIDRKLKRVSFTPLDKSYDQYEGKMITLPLHSEIKVQSSNGQEEPRALIKTDVIIKGKRIETFISLADRAELDYPVLIGKDILSGRFLIQAGL